MQVIQHQKQAIQEVRAQVNDKHLLATMKHLFKSNFSVLSELMQNARRAGASEVSYDFDPAAKTLTVTDNGKGITDFAKLIDLCTSGWEDDVKLSDVPFGMGFFSVFFACEMVTVRSNGLTLSASQADIVNKRAITVTRDTSPVLKGVVLELTGLNDALLAKTPHFQFTVSKPERVANEQDYLLYEKLKGFANAFPIEVLLNGNALPRPHALSNLSGSQTPLGFVYLQHIHAKAHELKLQTNVRHAALYLQGLPIQTSNMHSSMVIHLETQMFTPQMPDRTYLIDGAAQLDALQELVTQLVRSFLSDRKKQMDPHAFVRMYWESCLEFEVSHLLNDIPVVPRSIFSELQSLTCVSEDRWYKLYDSDTSKLVSKADIESGAVKAWRDVPQTAEYSKHWAVIQKVMVVQNIYQVSDDYLEKGHWIYKVTPSCDDFVVEVDPVGASNKSAKYHINDYYCEIKIVDAVEVKVTSKIDTAFLVEQKIDDSYVVVGNDIVDDESHADQHVTCYAMATGNGGECPVLLFEAFIDEHGNEDSAYQEAQVNWWDSLMNSLLGLPLAKNLNIALRRDAITIDDSQLGQMALVHATAPWNEKRMEHDYKRLSIVDLENEAVWERLAALLSTGPSRDADGLKTAFIAAIGGTGLADKPLAV